MKNFKGKAIYNPSGKAQEYSYWACNFYNGCSNGCEYCYCKKGILAKTMGGNVPTLKKCFKNVDHALDVFEKEVFVNREALKEHGLFFSFTTDPMLPETITLTEDAIGKAHYWAIPCKILTKDTTWVEDVRIDQLVRHDHRQDLIAYGFTLTGHDELEPNASSNARRINAMQNLHEAGFKTFASIEPVIDVDSSLEMIHEIQGCCDLFKVGLLSGQKYDKGDIYFLIHQLSLYAMNGNKIYIKDSVLKAIGLERSELPDYFVGRDYNLFQK